jgi:hypothetical protein
VNAHAAAVVPGMGVSVSTVLSELERQPGEFIIDPWVSERATLVAEQADRVAAAAHLMRYYADWLGLAQVERLLAYAWLEGQDPAGQDYTGYRAFLAASGFRELTRTKRG